MTCLRIFRSLQVFLLFTVSFAVQANPTMSPLVGQLAKQAKSLRLVQYIETNWTSTATSKTTATFSVNANDVLVAYAAQEIDSCAPQVSISGGGQTWTLEGSLYPGTGSSAPVFLWSATAGSNNASMSVTFTFANSVGCGLSYGGGVFVFRNSSGLGTAVTNSGTGAPSLNLTTTVNGSTVITLVADWNAVSGASRTWRLQTTEKAYGFLATKYTVYGGHNPNIGNAGSYTLGLTAPVGQQFSIIGIEVKP